MKQNPIDYSLFFVVFALVVFGMVMISSVSVYSSFNVTSLMVAAGKIKEAHNLFYLERNIMHVIIGFIMLGIVVKVPYSFFETYAKHIFIASLFFLFVVLFAGVSYNGARGWFNVPLIPFSLQPVEFAKLGLILYLAYFFKKKKALIVDFWEGLFPFLVIVGSVVILLGLQPDFGSIMLIAPLSVVLFYVAGGNIRHLLILGIICSLFSVAIYSLGKHSGTTDRNTLSYITDRVDNFFSDNKTAISNSSINYQTKQGLITIGSGGFFGLGFGKSIQKFGYLPEVQGDFIFSVIVEELGFIGACFLIFGYLYIARKGILIAMKSEDLFAKYVALGIVTWISLQTFINMGVNLNIVPLTGTTLPFVSYGGSSLLSFLLAFGILLNISRSISPEAPLEKSRAFRRRYTWMKKVATMVRR